MSNAKPRKSARSPQDKQKRRDQIIRAAIDLYVRKGFFAGSMNDLARELGIAKGTLYVYFRSKDALWRAIIELMSRELENLIQPIFLSPARPLEKLEKIARFTFDYYAENTDLCAILIKIWAVTDTTTATDMRSMVRTTYADYRRSLTAIIREGIEAGEIRPDPDPQTSASFILATLDGLMVQWLMEPELFNPKSCIETFRRVCIDGLAADR